MSMLGRPSSTLESVSYRPSQPWGVDSQPSSPVTVVSCLWSPGVILILVRMFSKREIRFSSCLLSCFAVSWGEVWRSRSAPRPMDPRTQAASPGTAGSETAGSKCLDEHLSKQHERTVLKELHLLKQVQGAWEFIDLSLKNGCEFGGRWALWSWMDDLCPSSS